MYTSGLSSHFLLKLQGGGVSSVQIQIIINGSTRTRNVRRRPPPPPPTASISHTDARGCPNPASSRRQQRKGEHGSATAVQIKNSVHNPRLHPCTAVKSPAATGGSTLVPGESASRRKVISGSETSAACAVLQSRNSINSTRFAHVCTLSSLCGTLFEDARERYYLL